MDAQAHDAKDHAQAIINACNRHLQAEGARDNLPPVVILTLESVRDRARKIRQMCTPPEPVDEAATATTDGGPLDTTIGPSGQQKNYVILSDEERAKGFVRPVRRVYKHVGARPQFPLRDLTDDERATHGKYGYDKVEDYPESMRPRTGRFWTKQELESGCQGVTTIGVELAETYARSPKFYGGTFCATCRAHYPVGEHGEFVWIEADGTLGSRVGT